MSFKNYFIKNTLTQFFIVTTCVCIVEAVFGILFDSQRVFSYGAFLSPVIFGALTSLTSLVEFSKRKQSPIEAKVRSALHFLLNEAVVFALVFIVSDFDNYSVAVALFISVFLIYAAVSLVQYLNDRRVANEINRALAIMRERDAGK